MALTSIRHGHRLIVLLRGDLDMASAPGALARIDQLLAEQVPSRLVLDLSRLEFLDSSGLAVLADLLKVSRLRGFDVALVGVGEGHRRLLDIVHMYDLFFLE